MVDASDLELLELSKRKSLAELIYNHWKAIAVGKEIGYVKIKPHVINIGKDTVPIFTPPYRIPYVGREKIETEVKKLRDQDVIEPCNSPWSSPIILLKKKNDTVRFAVDYRRTNKE